MELQKATAIAEKVLLALRPHCEKIMIAGSIRRKKPDVGDIEIVAIPKPYGTGLFETGVASVVNQWKKIKGELPCKYTQRLLPEGINLDLFFAVPDNWGFQVAVRTGSAEFSKRLAAGWVSRGLHAQGGILYDARHHEYIVPTEERLFELSGLPWVEPEQRNL